MRLSSTRRAFIAGMLLAPATLSVPPGAAEAAVGPPARRTTQPYLGAAVRMDQIEADPRLAAAVLRDCASLTAEIHMKWDSLQPEETVWRTAPADDLVAFATRNDLQVRGHTLLWDQSTPAWVRARLRRSPGDWSLIADYFETVLGRYAGAVKDWDVVNEPIDTERPDNMRATVFQTAFGSDYVERALREARRHAPTARLVINDYGFDYDNPVERDRRSAFLRLLERLKRNGAPLDGVGVQAHLDLGKGPLKRDILAPFFAELADLGLDIAITELDVKEQDRRGSLEERDRRVADHVKAYLDIALEQSAVTGVTTWGVSDRHSWLQSQPVRAGVSPGRLNRGLPYDAAMAPKPVYRAIQQAMSGAA